MSSFLIIALLFCKFSLYYTQTLMDKIQTDPELSQFSGYAEKWLRPALSEPSYTYTVFAPTDEAFERYKIQNGDNTVPLDTFGLWNYHLVNKKYTRQDFVNNNNHSVVTLAPKSAPIWITVSEQQRQQQQQYGGYNTGQDQRQFQPPGAVNASSTEQYCIYANQGKLSDEQTVASNGILHKVDRILYPMGIGETIWGFIEDVDNNYPHYLLSNLKLMPSTIRQAVDQKGTQRDPVKFTIFLPNDNALDSLSGDARSFLLSDLQLYTRIMHAHMIKDYVVFDNLMMKGQVYDAFTTQDRVQLHFDRRGNETGDEPLQYYVASSLTTSSSGLMEGDVYARIVTPNIAVENGVVHIIDTVLALIYRNVEETMQNHKNMTMVWTEIFMKSFMKELRDVVKLGDVTVFVPSNYAFEKVPENKLREFLSAESTVYELMRLHISNGKTFLRNQDNSTMLTTLNDEKKLRFMVTENNNAKTFYVNGDGVWGEVVQPNLGASNGVIHLIDSILGFPYQTMYEYSERNSLEEFHRLLSRSSPKLAQYLEIEDEQLTVFAPNNEAFLEIYRNNIDDYKALTDNNQVFESVMENHIVHGKVITLDDLKNDMQITTMNGQTLLLRQDGYNLDRWYVTYDRVEATVVMQGQRMSNGFLYIIDRVLYKPSDLRVSSSMTTAACLVLTLSMVLITKLL